jgi:hypothetical protein
MTAINDLVRMAYLINAKGANDLEPGLWQLAEAGEAFYSLYASVYELLGALLSLELFRVEFRMPAAPPSGEPPSEEKPSAAVAKESLGVIVGPINVYAIAKEIQDALDRLGKETVDVTAAYARHLPQESLPVIASATGAPFVEAPGPEPPESARPPGGSKKVEVPPVKPDHFITREAPRTEKAPPPPPVRPERAEASNKAPPSDKAPAKKASTESAEREVRRSVTMIDELRQAYDVLLADARAIAGMEKGARGFSLPAAAFGSVLKAPSQADELSALVPAGGHAPVVQAPSGTAIPTRPSIIIPVPMAGQTTPQVMPGTSAPTPAKAVTHAPGPEKGRPKAGGGEGEGEAIKLHFIHKNIEVPLIKPILKAPPTEEESAANARMISEAIAKSAAPIATPEPLPAPAPVKKPIMEHQVQPGYESARRPGDAPPVKAISPAQAARALSTVYSTAYHTVNVMEGYANLAASVSRVAREAAESGIGTYAEAPIVKLLYSASSPVIAYPASPINMPLDTGQIQAIAPAAEGRIEATALAINLMMGIAASRAMQSAGGSAINNFFSVLPSLGGGGLQGAIPVERMGNGQINIHVPPVSVERGQEAGAVSKVSNFHNTFNITVSVKGGGDEGDLRELGKKMGRILSDEIKRYGGI